MRTSLAALTGLLVAAGIAAGAEDALVKTASSGPVKATVSLSPTKPRLGDPLTLVLTVEAAAGVSVEMPPFGEALGRFGIHSFTPRKESLPDGSTRHVQKYVLDAPMSGRQRIPPLRIEFTDQRPGQAPDGGAHELLTDELAVDIASVLPEGATSELRLLRGPLPEHPGGRLRYLVPPLLLCAGAGAWLGVRALRRRRAQQVRVSAYDAAMARLGRLLRRPLPGAEEVDAFYVELSDIVRRYIEDRYGVRAPELTTEEFLREARHLGGMKPAHRELLEAFLVSADRVKFAGYRPGEAECRAALSDAGRFLEDSRATEAAP